MPVTTKWRDAAELTSRTLDGTLYARYDDLPGAEAWDRPVERGRSGRRRRWGKKTADDFAGLCNVRAREAGAGRWRSFVARNGAVVEQSQILTTHNLAVLVDMCDLGDWLRDAAPDLASRTLTWVVRRQTQPTRHEHAALQMIRNVAYAWRNAIFYLSFCTTQAQLSAVDELRDRVAKARLRHFEPAVHGLAHVVAGGRFTGTGTVDGLAARRLLGHSAGDHWCLPAMRRAPRKAPHA